MKHFLYFLISLFAVSCTIEQHVHINADGSGIFSYSIMGMGSDATKELFTDSLEVADSVEVTEMEDTLKIQMEEFGNRLKTIIGISDVKIDADSKTGKYGVSFAFRSLSVLNNVSKETEGETSEFFSGFTLQKKKFIYQPTATEEKTETMEKDMADMFKYTLIFSFEKKVKKVNNKNYVISADKHTVTYEGTINDISSKKTAVEIKLK